MSRELPPEKLIDQLDAISRTRALTDFESRALERAIRKGQSSKREAARLGIKRDMSSYRKPRARTILDRMAAALELLEKKWGGRRPPKAFYLVADDWAAFMATNPPTIETMFGNNPPRSVTDPAFREVPVRQSMGRSESRLYDNTATGRSLPE